MYILKLQQRGFAGLDTQREWEWFELPKKHTWGDLMDDGRWNVLGTARVMRKDLMDLGAGDLKGPLWVTALPKIYIKIYSYRNYIYKSK